MQPVYTVKEVAGYLKVSQASVYAYIRTGKLKAAEVGGVKRIRQEELDRFLAGEEAA